MHEPITNAPTARSCRKRPAAHSATGLELTALAALLLLSCCFGAAGEPDGGTTGLSGNSSGTSGSPGRTSSGSSSGSNSTGGGSGSRSSSGLGSSARTTASTATSISGSGSSGSSSTGATSGGGLPCNGDEGSSCDGGGTCEYLPASIYIQPPNGDSCGMDEFNAAGICIAAGVAADGGPCSATADTTTPEMLCPECEICSPRASTFPLGDCRPYVSGGFGGYVGACQAWAASGIPPTGLQPAAVVIRTGADENNRDLFNRAVYPLDAAAGCAIGYDPGLFLWCSGQFAVNPWGQCLNGADGTGWGTCGCPSQCHYGHCVLPCNPNGSCPDAGVPTTCSNGFCYQSCQSNTDCTASFMYYACNNGLCMNPDAGP